MWLLYINYNNILKRTKLGGEEILLKKVLRGLFTIIGLIIGNILGKLALAKYFHI